MVGNYEDEPLTLGEHLVAFDSSMACFSITDLPIAMDALTVTEHLQFYARVRGVSDVEHNVRAVIQAVSLQNFASRMAAQLSGGNKRKLSLAIALMGNPAVLLLDEPSSGMDAGKCNMTRLLNLNMCSDRNTNIN